MQLLKDNVTVYNGRILNSDELASYKEKYVGATEHYSNEETVVMRQSAYKSESDPLYMEWQFDQTTESEQAWRDKVTEIKARYPLTVES